MNKQSLDEIVISLNKTGLPERFTPDVSRFIVGLLRLLADGQPITPEQVNRLVSSQHIPATVADLVVNQMCERESTGNIVGLLGLSQNDHPHQFVVNGHTLSTWCAMDALFLPALINRTAQVASRCPQTKETVRLTITPDRVEQYSPSGAIVSIVIPQTSVDRLTSVEDIWMTFCHYIHFFSSLEAATQWFSTRQQEVAFLSVEDGYQVGNMVFGKILQYAQV